MKERYQVILWKDMREVGRLHPQPSKKQAMEVLASVRENLSFDYFTTECQYVKGGEQNGTDSE